VAGNAPLILFSITSVGLITTVTLSPFLGPSCSALRRVITLSILRFPMGANDVRHSVTEFGFHQFPPYARVGASRERRNPRGRPAILGDSPVTLRRDCAKWTPEYQSPQDALIWTSHGTDLAQAEDKQFTQGAGES
jgi:hypothetical protein